MKTIALISTLVSFLILVGYLGIYNKNHGTPTCVSDTWYNVKQKWLWRLFCSGVSVPLFVPLTLTIDSMNPLYSIPMMLTIGFMVMLGSFPDYKSPKTIDYKLHFPCAIIAALSSLVLSILLGGSSDMVILLSAMSIFAIGDKKNWLYYIETWTLFNIFLTIIKNIL